MSQTGKQQAIASRGYMIRFSKSAGEHVDYDTITCDLVRMSDGETVDRKSGQIKVRGGMVTKETEGIVKQSLITVAEKATIDLRNETVPETATPEGVRPHGKRTRRERA